MITKILIFPYEHIKKFVQENHPCEGAVFISVRDPGEDNIMNSSLISKENKLVLAFHDIVQDGQQLEKFNKLHEAKFEAFTSAQAQDIRDFIDTVQERDVAEILYVNCEAGISRSGGIGTWVANYVDTVDVQQFKDLNSHIKPNHLVLALLSRLLWEENREIEYE